MKPGLLDKLKSIAVNALRELEPGCHRVATHLEQGAVEDLRIDFEDGFGVRSAEEEDTWAGAAGKFAADARALPTYWGVRIKPMGQATRARALRTLELLLDAGAVPPVVTLPKITGRAEVEDLAEWLEARRLPCRLELMVETAYSVGHLGELIAAASGRCASLHFGAYDFLSELGVGWPDQDLGHPFCDQARGAIQRAVAGTPVRAVDGVTSLLPLGDRAREGWELHQRNVRRSLAQGFTASWDVHPAQVAARYVALFRYFAEHKAALGERLRNFVEKQARATRVGAAFDDAATIRGLAGFFAQGADCGALGEEALAELTGLSRGELDTWARPV